MKNIKYLITLILAVSFIFTGCGKKADNELIIGATPVPHAELLEVVEPLLEEQGIKLTVKEFTDYVTPNIALNDKEIDANFFQHVPYMDTFSAENNIDLVSVATIHVEPLGAYSSKISNIEEIEEGAIVAIPSDATNEGRALLLLQKHGFITLKDPTGLTQTPADIVDNPKNLKFEELEAASLPRALPDVTFAIINTNYALEADLNPTKNALFIESADSPYANIITTRPDNQDDEKILKLIEVLQSQEVREFIEEEYEGAIVPAF